MSIMLSETDLRRIFPHAREDILESVSAEWNETLARYGINETRNRLAYFMAQTGEETGGWRSMTEGGRFTGDRDRYRGRGLIQLTSRANYRQIGTKLARDFPDSGLEFDLEANPDLVAEAPFVLKTAAAFWDVNGINRFCDTGSFLTVCIKVNGRNRDTGLPNGWEQRQAELSRISRLLPPADAPASSSLNGDVRPADVIDGVGLRATGARVTALQKSLDGLGYYVGAEDGIFGTLTRGALLAFQADNNLPTTGFADAATFAALDQAESRGLSRERMTATGDDLAKLGSKTVINGKRIGTVGTASSILGGLGVANSAGVAIANKAQGTAVQAPATTANILDSIGPVVTQLRTLLNDQPTTTLATIKPKLQEVVNTLQGLRLSDLKSVLSPDMAPLLQRLKETLADGTPDGGKASEIITQLIDFQAKAVKPIAPAINTVFDLLPSVMADGSTMQLLTTGVAAVANSVLPGFGGAAATLAIGLLASHFGNQVVASRVADHQSGANLNR
jgi:predicted chitinase/peptidoglycan hydrolase-like protein with peptidoglycan-binding domain